MKVLFLKQKLFGGTNVVLDRAIEFVKKSGVHVFEFENNEVNLNIKYDVVIMPTSEIFCFLKLKMKGLANKKIIIWSMGHGAFNAGFFNKKATESHFFEILKILPKKFLHKLVESKSIIFTDAIGLHEDLSLYGINLNNVFDDLIVPIPIKNKNTNNYNKLLKAKKSSEPYNLLWLGRVSYDFKLKPLIDLIKELNAADGKIVNKFYVIGSGDGSEYFKRYIKSNNIYFDIEIINHIENSKLEEFIIEKNVDIGFCMGASSLDVANCNIPVVIVNPCPFDSVNVDNKYRFIYRSYGLSLGEFSSKIIDANENNISMDEVLYYIRKDGLQLINEKTNNYLKEFSEEVVAKKIFDRMNASKEYKFELIDKFILIFFYLKFFTKRFLCKK